VKADKILVVRLSAVGDCVHALPAVRALRERFPGAHLSWAVDDRAAPLLEGLPEVNDFLVMPRRALRGKGRVARWRRLSTYRRELKAAGFDVAVDLQGLAKSALVGFFSRAATRIGFPRAGGAREMAWIFYNCTPEVPEEARHVAEKSRALLAPLGVDLSAPLPSPSIPEHPEAARRVAGLLDELGLGEERFAVLNPGAGWPTKLWPPEHFAALAAKLGSDFGLEVLVTWFGPEREMAEAICAGGEARLAPPTDLQELAELLRRAALYVGSDTGPTHIAAAVGAPTVALFGAADAERNAPLGSRVAILSAGLDCSPCWKRSGCPRGVECMKAITPERVAGAAGELGVAG
jgi:lipopolysaccharide heptosyltransferase I